MVTAVKPVAPLCVPVAAWSICGICAVLVVWLCVALARVENERYALSLGMCRDPATSVVDYGCMNRTQTRTGWYWHVFYALKG